MLIQAVISVWLSTQFRLADDSYYRINLWELTIRDFMSQRCGRESAACDNNNNIMFIKQS